MTNPLRVPVTRRQMLQLAAVGAAATALPLSRRAWGSAAAASEPLSLFLANHELAVLDAATARLFPTDTTPGAREIGAVTYIQGLLSALPSADANCDGQRGAADLAAITQAIGAGQSDCAAADVNGDGQLDDADLTSATLALFEARPLFGGGPFSGRTPFQDLDAHTPSTQFPRDAFGDFVAPNRVMAIAWRVRIEGPSAAPDLVASNPLLTAGMPNAVDIDFRRRYRDGVAAIDAQSQTSFGAPFLSLTGAQQDQVLSKPPLTSFVLLLTNQMIEGLFCAPEYGGNRNTLGWQLIGYDGDSQPLGHTFGFDQAQGAYVDRPDQPNTAPSPGENCAGFSSLMLHFLRTLVGQQDSFQEFPTPECIGV